MKCEVNDAKNGITHSPRKLFFSKFPIAACYFFLYKTLHIVSLPLSIHEIYKTIDSQ